MKGSVLDMWSEDAILEALDCNSTDAVASWSACDHVSVVREDSCTYTMSRVPFPMFNAFMKPRFPSASARSYADLSLMLARRNSVPIMWIMGAKPSPPDFGDRLLIDGFLRTDTPIGMAARLELADLVHITPLLVKEVTGIPRFDEWCDIVCASHDIAETFHQHWKNAYLAAGFGREAGWRHFVGYIGGEPVAASSSFVDAGVVSISNVSVAPDYRGWGFGHDVSAFPLAMARNAGYSIAAIWSNDRGRPVYEKIGFMPVCRGAMYLWTPD